MNQERVRREGKEERRNFGPSLRGQKNPLEFQLFFLVFFLFTVFFFFFFLLVGECFICGSESFPPG